MAPFTKPETVLKQAEGLVSVGQTHAALQSLTEMFSSKRFRSTPLASLEPIMLRFVGLCVDLRKGRTAKEGLMQYKNIAQNTSVASIETVITHFVKLADAKVQEAQEKAERAVALDVDDLEASETPESILLGAVSGDQSKDRTDRALVTPWLKFLWESYRTSLETLKNNARLEAIYQQIAQQAFQFCLKHQRKVEFRRLCETLRLHLANVAKYSHQPHSINLADGDTLQHHLDTRFAQLNTSVELELWQEAFRSVEDVHNLLTMAKKAPRPAMMANYYEKLTKIFLMEGSSSTNALYHAAAWSRYYSVFTSMPGKSSEDIARLAGQVLISALAVPAGVQNDSDDMRGKPGRLTALLGLSKPPTRAGLLKEALSRDVLRLSPEPVQQLYNVLEVTFDPLTLCSDTAPLLNALAADAAYKPYNALLQRALLSRLLAQIAQVFSSIDISRLLELVKPLRDSGFEGALDDTQVEAYVMGCARRGELNLRVDHAAGSISFSDGAFAATDEPSVGSALADIPVQPSAAESVRTRMSTLATTLHTALEQITPAPPPPSAEEQQEKFSQLVAAAEAERKALQLRCALVARRRELLSELSVRKEKEEASKRAEASRREREEEARRAKEDLRRREQERIRKDVESIRQDEAKKLADQLIAQGTLNPNTLDEMKDMSKDRLMQIQVEQLEKEKSHMNERMRIVTKRIDHVERAYRKEERPLLAEDYHRQQESDRTLFESLQKSRVEGARQAHQHDLATKARLARMMDDYEDRRQEIEARRGADYKRRKELAARKIEEEKAKRRKAVLAERQKEADRLAEEERIRREQEEEEERLEQERLAEEARRAKEEEDRLAEEAAKKAKAEAEVQERRKKAEEERAAAAAAARAQMQREEEAMRRMEERKKNPPAAPAPLRAQNGGDSVWRRSTPTGSPANTTPSTPTRAVRTETPPTDGVAKFRPGGGSWRQKEAARQAGTASPRPESPAPSPPTVVLKEKDDDGFQTVQKKEGVWRSSRGRGRGAGF